MERIDTVEHGILCTLALSKKMKFLLKDYKSEEDQQKVLKGYFEDEQTEGANKSGGTITPHLTSERKRAVRFTQQATGGKMLDYNEECEASFDESDDIVGSKKQDAYRS